MRLSEAMILGSTMIRHGRPGSEGTGEGCALQCAAKALTDNQSYSRPQFDKLYPGLFDSRFPIACSCCDYTAPSMARFIMHLNDYHKLTIDAIAEWVATVEPKEPEATDELLTSGEVELALTPAKLVNL